MTSASLLRRRLNIDSTIAAQFLNQLGEMHNCYWEMESKPRKVLINNVEDYNHSKNMKV